MGRGGGCFPSKSKQNVTDRPARSPSPKPDATAPVHEDGINPHTRAEEQEAGLEDNSHEFGVTRLARIYIIFYSMYGHVEALAKQIKSGVDSVEGAQGLLFRVPETLPQPVLDKMQAPPKDESIPFISPRDLPSADAFLFGFPTRYGAMAAQMKAFFDSTSTLWQNQQLAGKPAGFFVSSGTQGGGQETTAWTAITQLAHHGMLYVPVGYTYGAGMFKLEELRGGSPYGAGTFAGDGSRSPSDEELGLAEHQGRYTAGIVKRLLTNSSPA